MEWFIHELWDTYICSNLSHGFLYELTHNVYLDNFLPAPLVLFMASAPLMYAQSESETSWHAPLPHYSQSQDGMLHSPLWVRGEPPLHLSHYSQSQDGMLHSPLVGGVEHLEKTLGRMFLRLCVIYLLSNQLSPSVTLKKRVERFYNSWFNTRGPNSFMTPALISFPRLKVPLHSRTCISTESIICKYIIICMLMTKIPPSTQYLAKWQEMNWAWQNQQGKMNSASAIVRV